MRRLKYVSFVNASQLLFALACKVERDTRDAFHFFLRVDHGVVRAAGLLVPCAGLAEVQTAEQLAHKQDVGAFRDLRPERRVIRKGLVRDGRPQVRKASERFANLQEAHLGPLARRQIVELVIADSSQQSGVALQGLLQRPIGQWRAVCIDGIAADGKGDVLERMSAEAGHGVQHVDRFLRYVGADAVTGE